MVPAEAWLWPSWEAPRESGVLAGPTQHLSHYRVMGPPVSWALTPGDSCRRQDGGAPLWAGRPGPGLVQEAGCLLGPPGIENLRAGGVWLVLRPLPWALGTIPPLSPEETHRKARA